MKKMFTSWIQYIALPLCIMLSACSSSVSGHLQPGQVAPITRFVLLDGTTHVLSEFDGKYRVLFFWASWCSKSKRLAEQLNALSERMQSRDDVVFLALSADATLQPLSEFIHAKRLTNMLHACSLNAEYDEAFMNFQVEELPRVVVIDPQGVILQDSTDLELVEKALGPSNN